MKQRKDQPEASKERRRPRKRLRPGLVPDIDVHIHDSAEEVAQTQTVQHTRTQLGQIAGYYSRGEEPDVVEMVLHRPFGAEDTAFQLRGEGGLVGHGGVVVSWVGYVHVVADDLGVFPAAPHSREEGQAPGEWDCV